MSKCEICNKEYKQETERQKVCSPKCAIKLVKSAKKKKLTDEDRAIKLQTAINKLIRKIDGVVKCISCKSEVGGKRRSYAGHYYEKTKVKGLRFNLLNIWSQCYQCNYKLSGNLINYTEGLQELDGGVTFVKVCNLVKDQLLTLNKSEYELILKKVKKLIKELEVGERKVKDRITVREEFNKILFSDLLSEGVKK